MKRIILLLFTVLFSLFTAVAPVNAQIITSEKLITVDTAKQMLYAWDGGRLVNQSPVSTGMVYTPTVKGDFRIYKKLEKGNMSGYYPPYPRYFLKDVPYIMYFHGAYALHGAFWHNKFGTRVSHGCVNQPVAFSKWLYEWAPMNTRVVVF